MTMNIGHKIGSIAAVLLALMVASAVVSYNLVGNVSDELRSIAVKQLPVSEAVSRNAVHALEHGIILQRAIVLYGEEERDDAAIGRQLRRLGELRRNVIGEFTRARTYLGKRRSPSARTDAITDRLAGHIAAIETHYLAFADDAQLLLDALDAGDRGTFDALAPELNQRQDRIDAEIAAYRRTTAEMAQASVQIADTNERQALNINGALSVLAAIIGLGFALSSASTGKAERNRSP